MGLKERYDFDSLVNEAESRVLAELDVQIGKTPGICTCQDCVLDMAAYALNKVRPAYRVSLMGSMYANTPRQAEYAREISKAVKEGIAKVKANPSHD
ncbi:MAG TPA: late competence development ComFB family protein [Spirochaetia bacterium]|nr:late competence development ComFB family protein [Spirochaetia bacterium]